MNDKREMTTRQSTEMQDRDESVQTIRPAVNIFEDAEGITLQADMPGVSRDRLQLKVDKDQLLVEGDVQFTMPEGMEALYADVRATRYSRSFSLSRDGNRLVYSTYTGSRDNPRNEIRFLDRTTGSETVPLTLPLVVLSVDPRLSGDGSLLSWRTPEDGGPVSWVAPTDDPAGRELCRGCRVVDFFTDGSSVLASSGNRLVRRVIDDGAETTVLELADLVLLDADLSRDDGWLAFQVGNPDGTVSVHLAPVENPPVPRDRWIRIEGDATWIGAARWSADGATIYFISERDDFLCVWGQPLDPSTKVPVGEPFAAAHAHTSKMRMLPFAKHMWNLEVGADRLVFNAGEFTGDVYTAMLDLDE